jgi:hypothetical protein
VSNLAVFFALGDGADQVAGAVVENLKGALHLEGAGQHFGPFEVDVDALAANVHPRYVPYGVGLAQVPEVHDVVPAPGQQLVVGPGVEARREHPRRVTVVDLGVVARFRLEIICGRERSKETCSRGSSLASCSPRRTGRSCSRPRTSRTWGTGGGRSGRRSPCSP